MRTVCPDVFSARRSLVRSHVPRGPLQIKPAQGCARPFRSPVSGARLPALPQNDIDLDDDGFGSTEFPDLSPDTVTMWNEIHSNIIELNRSRLKALQELKYARNRLNELELQLADRDAKIIELERALEQTHWADGGSSKPLNGSSKKLVDSKADGKKEESKAFSPAFSNGNGKASTAVKTGITIKYYSGWDPCYIHFNADNKGWTNCPGEKLEAEKGDSNCKVRVINAKSMEFVLNNGSSGWDKPPPGSEKPNYIISEPGVYTLRNGKLEKSK